MDPDSLSCNPGFCIPQEEFAGFRISRRAKISRIPESKCPYGAITNNLAFFKFVKPTLYTPYCKFFLIKTAKKKKKKEKEKKKKQKQKNQTKTKQITNNNA